MQSLWNRLGFTLEALWSHSEALYNHRGVTRNHSESLGTPYTTDRQKRPTAITAVGLFITYVII